MEFADLNWMWGSERGVKVVFNSGRGPGVGDLDYFWRPMKRFYAEE